MPNHRPRVRAAMSIVAIVLSALLFGAPRVSAETLATDDALARQLVDHERAAWDKYVSLDAKSGWTDIAKQHRSRLQ